MSKRLEFKTIRVEFVVCDICGRSSKDPLIVIKKCHDENCHLDLCNRCSTVWGGPCEIDDDTNDMWCPKHSEELDLEDRKIKPYSHEEEG